MKRRAFVWAEAKTNDHRINQFLWLIVSRHAALVPSSHLCRCDGDDLGLEFGDGSVIRQWHPDGAAMVRDKCVPQSLCDVAICLCCRVIS